MNLLRLALNFRLILFKITILMMPIFGHSQEKTFDLKHQKLQVKMPIGWEVADQVMGQDLAFFGPFEKESRPIISVTGLREFDGEFSLREMRKKESDYRAGRMEFINKYNAELVKFIPYQRVSWDHLKEVHQIGYQYKHMGQEFIEMNFYYKCDRELHMASSLVTVYEEALHGPQLLSLLKSFKCIAKPAS